MKTQLLKSFIAILIFNSTFLISAKGQIVYTDVNPDDTVYCSSSPTCSDTFKLDLNNDGNIDFNFTHYYHYIGSCSGGLPGKFVRNAKVMAVNPNAYFGIDLSYPSSLNYGYQIDTSLNWAGSNGILRSFSRTTCSNGNIAGNWISPNDMYLPLKLSITGNNYYGWIKIQIIQIGQIYFRNNIIANRSINTTV